MLLSQSFVVAVPVAVAVIVSRLIGHILFQSWNNKGNGKPTNWDDCACAGCSAGNAAARGNARTLCGCVCVGACKSPGAAGRHHLKRGCIICSIFGWPGSITLMPGIGIAPAGNPGKPIACMGSRPEIFDARWTTDLNQITMKLYSPGMPGIGPGRSILPPINWPWGPMATVPGRSMGCISCRPPGRGIYANWVDQMEKIYRRAWKRGRIETVLIAFQWSRMSLVSVSVCVCWFVCMCVYISKPLYTKLAKLLLIMFSLFWFSCW